VLGYKEKAGLRFNPGTGLAATGIFVGLHLAIPRAEI